MPKHFLVQKNRALDTCLLVAGWKGLRGKVGYVIEKYGNGDRFAFNWG